MHIRPMTPPVPPLSPHELAAIVERTLQHYGDRADAFWDSTRGHDVSQNVMALIEAIETSPPLTILDLGCGPGRDLKTFADMGHRAVGVEAVHQFAAMARAHSHCDVWEQDLLRLALPADRFDGIFANAVLFHVPTQELPRVLGELRATLKPRGVLFCSNPHGNDEEGWSRGRYGAWLRPETWQRQVAGAGFVEMRHYYRPEGLPREQQPWFATVWRSTRERSAP
jgi:SAM-dependent methyltransferase